jgi:peptidoglycan hydrolase CwlO-like protein
MTRLTTIFRTTQPFCDFRKRWRIGLLVVIVTMMLPASVLAQDAARKNTQPSPQAGAPSADDEIANLRKQVQQLSGEVSHLRAELAKLERYRTIDYTRELMIKEEQRIRGLQNELSDNAAKETPLQKRLDEIDEQQRPDRIERSLAGVGSVKPEEDRDAISRRLANEKRHIQTELETLRANRTRIPSLITNAEESIARLKQRLTELRTFH